MDRPKTTPYIIEPILFGRDTQKKSTVECIVNGEYSENKLTVLPIVGPGGIGKTTFTQHIYQELKSHFDILVWICVSQTFSTARLAQEAVTKNT
jgi:Cdc6-like AAA superfamily ATPase